MTSFKQRPSFLERFTDFASARPDHPAVVLEGRSHSYGEVLSLARRLAFFIANHKEQARISIQLPQGAEAFAAMFGSAMAGAVYSPVNVDAPVERWSKAALKFEPEIIVTNDEFAAEAHRHANGATIISIDSLSTDELTAPLPPNDLVYVMFTSGSTGEPKGVMIPFDALSHYAEWAVRSMQVSPDDRWSQHPNIAFDLSVLDIFGALCGGATLYPITEAKDLLLPAKAIRRHGLTIWNSVPSVMTSMVKIRSVTEKNFETLRLLTFCGEPLLQLHLDAIFTARPDVIVHNTYGPTEATVSMTLCKLDKNNYREACGGNSVAIGDPIEDMGLHLVGGPDEDEGEIVITGPQLAKGYWREPGLTAGAFRPLDVGGTEHIGYFTGDWVRRDGAMTYFSGRQDNQTKIRGERIELDDIGAALMEHDWGVAVVAAKGDVLYAFIENEDPKLSAAEMRDALKSHLPHHLIPTKLYTLPRLPRSLNDKIDRRQLMTWAEEGVVQVHE